MFFASDIEIAGMDSYFLVTEKKLYLPSIYTLIHKIKHIVFRKIPIENFTVENFIQRIMLSALYWSKRVRVALGLILSKGVDGEEIQQA